MNVKNYFFQEDSSDNLCMNLDFTLNDFNVLNHQTIQKLNIRTSEMDDVSNFNENFNLAFNRVFKNNNEEKNDVNEIKKPSFSIEFLGKKKRGRKIRNNNRRRRHSNITEDNVITKIQTHFMSFIIDFINDCISSKNKRNEFKEFNYKIKSNTSKSHIKELKDSLLINIPISKKYKKYPEYTNKKLANKLSKDIFFKDLFKMKYSELFYYYYNDNKPLKEISINNKIIELKKTKTFYELVQENKDIQKRILEVTQKMYINKII